MVEIARSVDYFSKDNGLKYEKDPIQEVSKKTSMPKNFLSFFTNLISFISQYNEAFKEENFNRMGQLIVTINESIEQYFRGSSSELKDFLNELAKNASEKAANYISNKAKGGITSDEAAEQIESAVDDYKSRLLEKIQEIVFKRNDLSSNVSSNQTGFSKPTAKASIDAVNSIVVKKNEEFQKNVQTFSVILGKTIIGEFSSIANKLTEYNLKSFQKGLEKMNTSFSKEFYGVLSRSNDTIEQASGKFKAFFSNIVKVMKYSAITVVNTVSATVTALAVTYLTGKLILKKLYSFVSFVLGTVWNVVKFGIKLIAKTVILAFKAVKFVATSVIKVTGFLLKTTKRVIGGVFSLANAVFKKITGFSILGIVKTALKKFIFSYPGAFLLGYVCGTIWRSILKLAGVKDEDIKAGKYSVFKDGISNAINEAKEKIKNFFGDKIKSIADLFNEKMDAILKSDTFDKIKTQIDILKESVADIVKKVNDDIYEPVANFIESYVWPVAKWISIALAIITGEAIQFPKAFVRTYGAVAHGLQAITFFAKHPRLRGGLAGIIAGGVLFGTSMVLSSGPGYSDTNTEDQKNPLKLPLQKKYAALYGYTGEVPNEENKGPYWDDFTPQIDLDKQYLGRLSRIVRNANPAERELLRQRYDEVRTIYKKLMDTRNELWNYHSIISTLQEDYKKDPKNGWTILNYPGFISKIIYDEDGKLLYDPKELEKIREPKQQFDILNAILAERLYRTNARLQEFKNGSENEVDPFGTILGRSEEWKNEDYRFRPEIYVNNGTGQPERTFALVPFNTTASSRKNYSYNSDIFERMADPSHGSRPLISPRVVQVVPPQSPPLPASPPASPLRTPIPSSPSPPVPNPPPIIPTLPSILYTNAPAISDNNLPNGAQNVFIHTFNLLKLIVSRFQTSFIELIAKKNNTISEISRMMSAFNLMISPYITFKLNSINSFDKIKDLARERTDSGEIQYNITTAAYRIFDDALAELIVAIERQNPQHGLEKTILDFWKSMTLNPNDLKTALMDEYRDKFNEEIERNRQTQETIEMWLKKLDDNLT